MKRRHLSSIDGISLILHIILHIIRKAHAAAVPDVSKKRSFGTALLEAPLAVPSCGQVQKGQALLTFNTQKRRATAPASASTKLNEGFQVSEIADSPLGATTKRLTFGCGADETQKENGAGWTQSQFGLRNYRKANAPASGSVDNSVFATGGANDSSIFTPSTIGM
jgi:hypothetical protein